MKELFFATDLLAMFRDDTYYGDPGKIAGALRKLGLAVNEQSDDSEQMIHALVLHVMDQAGESEPFLEGRFIYPEAVVKLLKGKRLPAPAALQPQSADTKGPKSIDPGQFEKYFDTVCRNCGTVTDPLAKSYRTPIGRLIFKTFLETRLTLGINTTAKYVFEHLKDYDTGKIVTAVHEDYVTWTTEDAKEKLTSIETIGKFVLNFNRELKNLL